MRYLLLCLLLASSVHAGEHWPGWRGPTGQGHTDEKNLPLEWDGKTGKNVLWKVPLFPSDKVQRDQNQSSPIVWGDRVFVTISYWPEDVNLKSTKGGPAQPYPEHHVVCFRAKDGQKLWDEKIKPGPWQLADLRGGYTAPTPATDGQRVYALFGSSVLAALDLEGKEVWRKEIAPHFFDVAIGTSPVLFGDTVLVVCDQIKSHKASTIKAFDTKTGELRWEQKRPDEDWTHSTPTLAKINGKTQLLVATANGPQGLDPTNGEVLWSFRMPQRVGDTVSPVVHDGTVYIDSGRGGQGIAVDTNAIGDVSKKMAQLKWSIKVVPEGFSSPLVVGDQLYRLHTPGVLSSWKWSDGKEVFKERLQGADQAVSPIATPEGRIYLASAGKSYIVQAGPKLEMLATNDLGDPSRASPAVANGRIYLKGSRWLFCVGNPKE